MSEFLSAFSAVDWSAATLLALAVVLILFGGLIPRYVVKQMRTDRDERLAEARQEAADWKAAYMATEQVRQLQATQQGDLLELAKTTDAFIRSIGPASRRINE